MLIACGPLLAPAGVCTCAAAEQHVLCHTDDHDAPGHDDSHDPGCLTFVPPAPVKQLESAQPLAGHAAATAQPALAFADRTFGSPSSPVSSDVHPRPTPLYVCHCALVI